MCRRMVVNGLIALSGLLAAAPVLAAEGAPALSGAGLSLLWALPFAGILLSIALCPLLMPDAWHHHHGKIAAGWAALFIVPCAGFIGLPIATYELLHVLLLDFVPFIILLTALFTVAGGVRLRGGFMVEHGVTGLWGADCRVYGHDRGRDAADPSAAAGQ